MLIAVTKIYNPYIFKKTEIYSYYIPYNMTKKCKYPQCYKKILSLAIECDKCHKSYCGNHRIPESHLCEMLPNIKKEAFENNKINLEKNKIITVNNSLGAY